MILLVSVPAVVHPVAQLQLQGALGMSAVEDGHQAAQCVQVAAQISNCRSKHKQSKCKNRNNVVIICQQLLENIWNIPENQLPVKCC